MTGAGANVAGGSLFADLAGLRSGSGSDELFDTLTRSGATRIERIVSHGQSSPPGFWYDQVWDEFVLVVSGAAVIEIEGLSNTTLQAGDWMMIPAHCCHRVAWTSPDGPTVWLAVHIGEEEQSP